MSEQNETAKKLSAELFAEYETERAMKWMQRKNHEFSEKHPAGTPQPERSEEYWIIKGLLNIANNAKSESPRPDWTPCAEGMPEIGKGIAYVEVLCSVERNFHGFKYRDFEILRYSIIGRGKNKTTAWMRKNPMDTMQNITVIAWQPLPAPYRADQKEDNADDHK